MWSVAMLVLWYSATARALRAQDLAPRWQMFLGPSIARFETSHPEGAPLALGGTLGVARSLARRASLRAVLGVMGAAIVADDIGVCHGNPDIGCLPDAVFPRWLTSLEIHGGIRPVRRAPLGVVAGAGIVRSDKAGENENNARLFSSTTYRGLWRAGIELTLGSTPYAPRLQYSRVGFASSIHSLTFVDGFTLSFWPSMKFP